MKRIIILILASLFFIMSFSSCTPKAELDPKDPVTLTMWHVYGSHTESPLNDSINEFNRTVGKEEGIVINVVSVSSSSAIDEALTASANNTPGSPALPDLFTAYPRVADIIGQDRLLDWSSYFTEEELSVFVDDFISEGYFDDKLLMLPIAKSTELLFLNKTLFDKFSAGNGKSTYELSTFEGLFSACEAYYDYTDGSDMFQINDFYHYSLTGMAAFGEEFVTDGKLNLESDAFAKVWEPMAHAGIHGGLCLGDGYASDRWKTGEVISNIGSTAGILYLRDYVTYADNTTEDIETAILAYPRFADGKPVVVHRGGGLFAIRNDDERKNLAAAVFAKWLTEKENSLGFVTKTGYLPVTEDAFEQLFADTDSVENEKYRLLYGAVSSMSDEYTYAELPLYDGASEMQSSFEKNVKSVLSSAHNRYLERVAQGENPETVLDLLVITSLEEIRSRYN